uniref:FERM domain-containing protein n=1 Tax=Trichuris muris TaxID=70415 RepID=A0A5S6Q954_TRIMR
MSFRNCLRRRREPPLPVPTLLSIIVASATREVPTVPFRSTLVLQLKTVLSREKRGKVFGMDELNSWKRELPTLNCCVNLPNGSYNCVRYDNNTDVYTVTRCILKRLNIEEEAVKAVALRCACSDDVGKSGCSCQWLEPSDNICRLLDFLNCSHQERKLKFELRIRYFQFDLRSWCQAMPKAFGYLYEQVKEDYFACTESNVNFDVALLLGSLILGHCPARQAPERRGTCVL